MLSVPKWGICVCGYIKIENCTRACASLGGRSAFGIQNSLSHSHHLKTTSEKMRRHAQKSYLLLKWLLTFSRSFFLPQLWDIIQATFFTMLKFPFGSPKPVKMFVFGLLSFIIKILIYDTFPSVRWTLYSLKSLLISVRSYKPSFVFLQANFQCLRICSVS